MSSSQTSLGQSLRRLREERGLSRIEVAVRTGISSVTIKAWETNRRVPRGPQLERVLDAFETPERLRAELLAAADPHHAQRALAAFPLGPPIDLGMILRAFRLRRRMTQTEAARALDVAQSAVAQWETGERAPAGPILHRILFVLGANAEEVAAVLTSPHGSRTDENDPNSIHHEIERLPGALREPAMLANEHSLWWRAIREPSWDAHLRRAFVQRAVWYAFTHRFGEVDPLIRRVRRMMPDPNADSRMVGADIVLSDVRFRPNVAPMDLFWRLDPMLEVLHLSPERAWALGTRAVALSQLGDRRSVAMAEGALEEALRLDHLPVEAWHRRVDLAEVHLRLGDAERALETIGDEHVRWDYPAWAIGIAPAGLPVRARALIALGREPEGELMKTLRDHAALDGTVFYEERLARVERGLAGLRTRSATVNA